MVDDDIAKLLVRMRNNQRIAIIRARTVRRIARTKEQMLYEDVRGPKYMQPLTLHRDARRCRGLSSDRDVRIPYYEVFLEPYGPGYLEDTKTRTGSIGAGLERAGAGRIQVCDSVDNTT